MSVDVDVLTVPALYINSPIIASILRYSVMK